MCGQVLLTLIFSAAFFQQAVLAPDAFQGAMADGQIELADQAARAESGQGLRSAMTWLRCRPECGGAVGGAPGIARSSPEGPCCW